VASFERRTGLPRRFGLRQATAGEIEVEPAPSGPRERPFVLVAAHEPIRCAQLELYARGAIPAVVHSFEEVIKKVHMTFWDRHPVG